MDIINDYSISLSQDTINQLEKEILDQYQKYLAPYGVKPLKTGTNAMYQLILLYYYQGKAVSKDVITKFVQTYNPSASGDQQVRHLSAQKGYYILGKNAQFNNEKMPLGYYLLVNLIQPDPAWCNNENKRRIILTTDDFDSIKQEFNYCCATCGMKEGTIHRYTGKVITLQKGHIDPSKPLEKGNIIPQCEYCNQNIYKNDYVFDESGYPKYIYNPKYVLKSPLSIQQQIYNILKLQFEGES